MSVNIQQKESPFAYIFLVYILQSSRKGLGGSELKLGCLDRGRAWDSSKGPVRLQCEQGGVGLRLRLDSETELLSWDRELGGVGKAKADSWTLQIVVCPAVQVV